jgi:hypothetical protein
MPLWGTSRLIWEIPGKMMDDFCQAPLGSLACREATPQWQSAIRPHDEGTVNGIR